MRRTGFALLALAALALGGCYEDVTPTRYSPGVYKGEKDPLLSKLQEEQLQSELEERFRTAATDR